MNISRHWRSLKREYRGDYEILGSTAAFDEFIKVARDHESSIAQTAVEYYGSVEKYTDAMKESLSHFSENMENMRRCRRSKKKGVERIKT